MEGWIESQEHIETFLSYGYLPQGGLDIHENVLEAASGEPINMPESDLINRAQTVLENVFERRVANYPESTTHLVPLSGGYDSRTILGGLLTNTAAENIQTVTFGVPGTLDYELGAQVAKRAGVKNLQIDLRPQKTTQSREWYRTTAREQQEPKVLFGSRDAFRRFEGEFDSDYILWTGYMGEAMAGDHLPPTPSESWEEALEWFLTYNYDCPKLTTDTFDPMAVLPSEPAVDESLLSYDHQLDFGVRQPYRIAPSVITSEDTETPYLDPEWVSFILNVPRKYRTDRTLFRAAVTTLYDDLFDIQTDRHMGAPEFLPEPASVGYRYARAGLTKLREESFGRQRPHENTNFIDWDYELRTSRTFRSFIKSLLFDLEDRNTADWVDVREWLQRHENGEQITKEFRQLASLELYLALNE